MWLFFGVTLLAGGLLHRDIVALVGVLLAVAASTVQFLSQSRIKSMADLKRALVCEEFMQSQAPV